MVRPVTVELWGHGRSPVPEDTALFHPDAYVAEFERLREGLGAERWMICGQSLGAALTMRYALDFPERVSAQVFTNSTSAFADAAWAERIRRGAAEQGEAIVQGGLEGIERMPIHPRHATRLPEEFRAALIKDGKALNPLGVARTVEFTVPETPVRERTESNRVPTLLVCGTREKRFAPYRAFAEKKMPRLEVVETGAGHAVNIEAAEAFNAAVVSFLERHSS